MARIIAAGHVANAVHGGEDVGRQALGLPGWSPSLRRKVRSTAAGNLKRFLAQSG